MARITHESILKENLEKLNSKLKIIKAYARVANDDLKNFVDRTSESYKIAVKEAESWNSIKHVVQARLYYKEAELKKWQNEEAMKKSKISKTKL